MSVQTTFRSAANAFIVLVAQVPHDAWDRPALGVWDVRSLIGHTGRALSTVLDYLAKPADVVELGSAAAYLAAGHRVDPAIHEAVAARGIQAGHDLGDDAAEVLETLAERVDAALDNNGVDAVIRTRFGAIRLEDYLATRVVELTVHTSDLAAALQVDPHLPDDAVALTLRTVAEAALLTGRGLGAIRQLSARDGSTFVLF